MQSYLSKINSLVAELRSLEPLKEEDKQRLNKKMRLEFSYNSNHLEGNTLTYGETQLFLFFGKTTGDHEGREYEEMKAHDVCFQKIKEMAASTEVPLTEKDIKNLNEILLVEPFWKEAISADGSATRRLIKIGDYKEFANNVKLQNGETFHFAKPEETAMQMGDLMQWYRTELDKKELHAVQLAAIFSYRFVRIHPFDDGNGRVSRLLMNYILLQNNLPPVIIKSADKKNYLFALNKADTGDVEAFVEYIANEFIWSLDLYVKAGKGESIEEENDWEKELVLIRGKLADGIGEVSKVRSVDTIREFLLESLQPLMQFWKTELEKVASIVQKSELIIHYSAKTRVGTLNISGNEIVVNENLVSALASNDAVITFVPSVIGLRNFENGISINAGKVSINLFQNSFEYQGIGSLKVKNKLYSQPLTSAEIKLLVNNQMKFLTNNIQQTIEKE